MKAPQYVVNNLDLNRYNKYKMNIHLEKLKEIRERKQGLISNTPIPGKYPSKKFLDDQKKLEIYKENRALFGRILHISQNYSNSFEKSFSYNRNSFKSSYEISRKNQERKIAAENEKIVKKLTDIKPSLQKKTLDQEYLEYTRRKRRLLKVGILDSGRSFDSERSPLKGSF